MTMDETQPLKSQALASSGNKEWAADDTKLFKIAAANMKARVALLRDTEKLSALRAQVKDQWFWILITCICLILASFLENFVPFYGGNIVHTILTNNSFTKADQLKLAGILISVGPLRGVAIWLAHDMAARTTHGMGNIIDKKEENFIESLFTFYLFGVLKNTATTLFAFRAMCNISPMLSKCSLVVVVLVFVKEYGLPIFINRPQAVHDEDFLTSKMKDVKIEIFQDLIGNIFATMFLLAAGVGMYRFVLDSNTFRISKLFWDTDLARLSEFMIYCAQILCALYWIGQALLNGKKDMVIFWED